MKALSVQQPWAWLIVNGYKPIENREWSTNVRGRIAIHAGKKFDTAGLAYVRRMFPEIQLPDVYPMGGVVGYVTLTDVVRASYSRWFQGTFGFEMRDAEPCAVIRCRGQLGFFDVPVLAAAEL